MIYILKKNCSYYVNIIVFLGPRGVPPIFCGHILCGGQFVWKCLVSQNDFYRKFTISQNQLWPQILVNHNRPFSTTWSSDYPFRFRNSFEKENMRFLLWKSAETEVRVAPVKRAGNQSDRQTWHNINLLNNFPFTLLLDAGLTPKI